MDTTSLIDSVRSFTFLYNKKDPLYSDKIAVENAWQTVATIVDVSVEDCQNAWKNIKDRYAKERRLMSNRPSGGTPYYVKWPYFRQCSFLNEFISQRKTKGSIKKLSADQRPSCSKWTDYQELIVGDNGSLIEKNQSDIEPASEEEETNNNNASFETENNDSDLLNSNEIVPKHQETEVKKQKDKLKELRQERNLSRKGKEKGADAIDKLAENSTKVGETIQQLVANLIHENESTESKEDYYFGMSIGASLGKMKNSNKKTKLKANILLLIADADE